MNLFDKNNRFNIANLVTFTNIALGVIAIYFIVKGDYFIAIVLAWMAGWGTDLFYKKSHIHIRQGKLPPVH